MVDLFDKFMNRTLTKEDVIEWLDRQRYSDRLPEECKDEFARLILRIMDGYHEKFGFGDFLSAILNDDLLKAVGHADSCNKLLIPYYVVYLWNNAPANIWSYAYLK